MKRLTILLVFVFLFFFGVKSQTSNIVSIRLAFNQIELNYHRKFMQQQIWGEAFIGVGNQDVNSNYDDFLTGIKIGTPVFSDDRNVVSIFASAGVYFPKNGHYSVVTPFYGGGIGYTRFIGKAKKHSLLINAGYLFGKSNYIEEYNRNDIFIASTGRFAVSPLCFSIGYGFHF